MTPAELARFRQAVAEEEAGREENIAAAQAMVPHLLLRAQQNRELIQRLRAAREAAGVSLAELQDRTGIRKSALSRLENSKAPNPTLASLQRYAEAIGFELAISLNRIDS